MNHHVLIMKNSEHTPGYKAGQENSVSVSPLPHVKDLCNIKIKEAHYTSDKYIRR
jgi:hypothetical protein